MLTLHCLVTESSIGIRQQLGVGRKEPCGAAAVAAPTAAAATGAEPAGDRTGKVERRNGYLLKVLDVG